MLRDWKIEIGRIGLKDRVDVVIDTGACNKTSRILNILEFLMNKSTDNCRSRVCK